MPERSALEATYILRRLIKRFSEKKRCLHMAFSDLKKKLLQRIPREVI